MNETPQQLASETVPINKHTIRSLFVTPENGAVFAKGKPIELEGVAFDGGDGITKVEISSDGGKSWIATQIEKEMGKYAWRRWRARSPPAPTTKWTTIRAMCRG